MSCKKLNLLTQTLGKHMFYNFVQNNQIQITDHHAANILSLQYPKSPFKDVMYLSHYGMWYTQLHLTYLQYKNPQCCMICNTTNKSKFPLANQCTTLIHISEWHISVCNICVHNCLFSESGLISKYPDAVNAISHLLPCKLNGQLYYFYPCFLMLYEFDNCQSILSNLSQFNNTNAHCHVYKQRICQEATPNAIKQTSIPSFLLPFPPVQVDPWLLTTYNHLAVLTGFNPLVLIKHDYPNVANALFSMVSQDDANSLYADLLQIFEILDAASKELDKQGYSQHLDDLNPSFICRILENDDFMSSVAAVLDLQIAHPNVAVMTPSGYLMNTAFTYLELVEARLIKINLPVALINQFVCLVPNFNKCKHGEVVDRNCIYKRLMHWAYDAQNGGNSEDLTNLLNLLRLFEKQEIRMALVKEEIRNCSTNGSWLYYEYVYLLDNKWSLTQVINDVVNRNKDIEAGDKCAIVAVIN